jgi:hypothetical protein
MAFSPDEILKAWDEAVGKVARIRDDATDEEIAAATAIVGTKCPGVTAGHIREALRANVEELEGEVASLDRALQILKGTVDKESEGTLPGLPGGPPLKH